MSYRIAKIASKAVNLITVESLLQQGLLSQALRTRSPAVFTTVDASTHLKYAKQITQLTSNPHVRIVPYYAPLVYAHHASTLRYHSSDNPPRISLLIGECSPQFLSELDGKRVVTLEQVCRAFPEKVPLSMRDRNSAAAREKLQERIGMKMGREKVIEFQNILVGSGSVHNWDEAFQVLLDCQPSPIIVPYLKIPASPDGLYRLGLNDFMSGLVKIHQTVSTAVKTHPPLNLVWYDQRKQLNWIISQIANEAEQMAIDSYFFTDPPKLSECTGRIKIAHSLQELL